MHHFIFPSQDTWISSGSSTIDGESFKDQNFGRDQILEVKKEFYNSSFNYPTRALVNFSGTEFTELSKSLADGTISPLRGPAALSGTKVYLRLFEAEGNAEMTEEYTLAIQPISQSWTEGIGKFGDNPKNTNGCSWENRSNPIGGNALTWSNAGVSVLNVSQSEQSFSNQSPDIDVDITNMFRMWYNGQYSNYGMLINFSGSQETDSTTFGHLKFFSRNTHTIFSPKLEVRWNDSSFSTGALTELTMSGLADNFLYMKGLREEYKVGERVKFRVGARKRYIQKTFTNSVQTVTGSFITNGSGSYAIKDVATDEFIVPFEDSTGTSYTKLSCDSDSNYFIQYLDGFYPDRVYKILLKLKYDDGQEQIFDNDFEFIVKKEIVMAYSQDDNQEFNVEATLQSGDLEGLLDAIANALIQSPLINPSDVENNQKFIRNGQIQIGQGEGFLALYQKDVEANVEDDLQSVADSINGLFQINIQEGVDGTVSVNVSGGGIPAGGQDITNLVFGENNPLNVSQFIPLQLSSSLVDIEKAEEFLDTNIFELLPSGDARQARIVRFFQELNALLPPTPPQFDLDGNGKVDRGMDNSWTGSLQYSKDNSISYAQDNIDGNIDEEDAFIHRLKSTSNDTNSSRTIEDIYNRVLPYLTDRLEDSGIDEDGRPVYENQSSGYLKFRNLNQGIIIRNTNQDFIEGLNPNNLNYLNTDGTGGFTITMWVRFLDKVSEGTLFNFGNPTRDENPFGFKLETFVLNKNNNTLYPPDYDPNGAFTTWGSTVENTTDLKNQGIFGNSNTARFVRLQVREVGDVGTKMVRDSHMGNNSIRKISWNYPDFRYRDGVENSMSLRLINSTFIPENFNEWYFICASYNPNVIEPRRYGDGTNDIEPDIYDDYKSNQNFWLNHVDPLNNGSFTNFSNYGNKCKVEIISKSQLLRARGFKV